MCCFRQSCFVGFYYIRKCLLKMQQGVPPGRLRRAPPTTGAPPRRRWSGKAQRVISLLRRGAGRRLRWLLAQGRWWVRLWLRPEP